MKMLFGIWCVVGMLVALVTMFGLWTDNNLTVIKAAGYGAYISCGMLFWIGGMVLFGFASFMVEPKQQPALSKVDANPAQ